MATRRATRRREGDLANSALMVAEAAAKRLGFTDLVPQNLDSKDFQEVFIGALIQQLEMAYRAGYDAGQSDAMGVK